MSDKRHYLGDGAYVELYNGDVILTTETGHMVTNRVVLEPTVYRELVRWVEFRTGATKEETT